MELSCTIAPLPSDCTNQLYKDKGPAEGLNGHLLLVKSPVFLYHTLLGELMYSFIMCQPDIGYAVTALSKFSSAPSPFHYKILKGVAKYLQSTIDWNICFHCPKRLNHPYFSPLAWYDIKNYCSVPFDVNLNQLVLIGFVDSAHANNLRKCRSTTGLVFTFCDGAIVYKSKTQSLTAGSSTKDEFIAAHTAAKISCYLHMLLKQLRYENHGPTPIQIDNMSALKIINKNMSPTEQT